MDSVDQVQDGEVAISARAIDESLIMRLVAFNRDSSQFPPAASDGDPAPQKRKRLDDNSWNAGHELRVMLNCIYIFAFLCLLRFDEVLNIKWSFITLQDLPNGGGLRLKLMLPFRKTHQTGGMSSIQLYCSFLHLQYEQA